MLAPPHPREAERIAALRSLSILDTPPEQSFDDITDFASRVCGTPISLITFVDSDRQWFKSACGIGDRDPETPREDAICDHAMAQGDYLEIPDTTKDPRTADNSLVTPVDGVRFYAGAVLRTSEGMPVGSVCVLDTRPRELDTFQRETLLFLAKQVMAQIGLRKALEQETALRGEIDHRVKNSLQTVASILRVQRATVHSEEAREAISAAERRIKTISLMHNELYSTESYQALELRGFIGRLCGLLRATLPDGITLNSAIDPVDVPSGKAKAIAMIIGEFIANSSKHAFDEGATGVITVEGRATDNGYDLLMHDNGRGMTSDPAASTGLGQRIIAASVDQLGGEFHYGAPPDGGCGSCLHISFVPVLRPVEDAALAG
ncbi:histidine kinase dimerization/phosphoacceptor domain -containing protein [Anianabacter salinae]|uniref:histidine kinase dimerization/phosphoacceptor domain -containing protein n=1 Tax=Anianabacter salinae TaxID=2851023 RepID=UPI00225DD96A|nr:histidine kinase dimerization/phosphoacceptor domain -containing protein [Anianabacter salinae]MBV0912979.1 GAF domain-containing protein [Anianabacter salinae]